VVELTSNILQDNGTGILLAGTTSGNVSNNQVRRSKNHGIQLSQNTQSTIDGNTCEENGSSGICCYDDSSPVIRNNKCRKNAACGIAVDHRAQPTVEENVCEQNEGVGISLLSGAQRVVRRNQCMRNGAGISVSGQSAHLLLEANHCEENTGDGIYFKETALGTARANQCVSNGLHGIEVAASASPTIEENVCRNNSECGIAYDEQGSGTARRNRCAGNGTRGISVSSTSQSLILEENICDDNNQYGISFHEDTRATARRNNLPGNAMGTIWKHRSARPKLDGNIEKPVPRLSSSQSSSSSTKPANPMDEYDWCTVEFKHKRGTKTPTLPQWTTEQYWGLTEFEAKLKYWQENQAEMRKVINALFITDNWELVSELGPGAVEITTNFKQKGGGLFAGLAQMAVPKWAMVGFTISFRRLKGQGRMSAAEMKRRFETNTADDDFSISVTLD
jgi:parallel beta-helix repeat protein